MALTAPTTAYRPVRPSANDAAPYIPWLIDRAVRVGRDNGYAEIVDDAIELVLSDFAIRRPVGGFVDSDGRNARGVQNGGFGADGFNADGFNRDGLDRQGFNRAGVNAAGQTREDAVEALVESWDADTAAAVLTLLADRIA